MTLDTLEDLIARLERAAEQLRSGELSADAAASMVEDCAALATQASSELERRTRAEIADGQPAGGSLDAGVVAPGQDSLL
jgi:exonuclease VII small subunit